MTDTSPLVLIERSAGVATVTLNRPKQLNALSGPLMQAIVDALTDLDHDTEIRAIVLAGVSRAFAAGADIAEMSDTTAMEFAFADRVEQWDKIRSLHTPLVAAVSGFCLGGGCELAMACDLIVASETAVFGQPETGVGIIPGAGGTQRLTHAVGKAVAMDMILTGRTLDAGEARAAGLVARVVAMEAWLSEAQAVAARIASRAPLAQRLARESVDRAFEMPLSSGLAFERKSLYLAFASEDAREGLAAFVERRAPEWKGA
jgi:enoyl-CoA hydratase